MKKTLLFIFFLKSHLFLFAQHIWHVKFDATGSNTGLNWPDAFNDLQSALQIAHYGDDIWVAAGTYKPTTNDNRSISFDLPVGVRLAGGFAGTETLFGERDMETNTTILSGDIGSANLWEDNSYHVVRVYGGDTLTVLDGFKIEQGRADVNITLSPIPFGGGILVMADLERPLSVPVIQNCLLERNQAYFGGGIGCYGYYYQEHIAAPRIKNCKFQSNLGLAYGGGFYKQGNCEPARPLLIENCEFLNNYCFNSGGGIAIVDANGRVILNNNTFVSDSAFLAGGGVFLRTTLNMEYTVSNCKFLYNFAGSEGSSISHRHLSGNPTFNIKNSFLSFNVAPGDLGGAISFISGAYKAHQRISIENCRLEHNEKSGLYISEQSDTSDVRIDRCFFLDNKPVTTPDTFQTYGGGYQYYATTPESEHRCIITNSVFAFNAGAVASRSILGNNKTIVANCTFLNNGVLPFYKNRYAEVNTDFYQKMQILNSIIWEADAPGLQYLFYNNDLDFNSFNVEDYLVEHSLIISPTCEYEGVNPCGTGMIYESAPQFVSTDSSMPDVSVSPDSPVINRGSNVVSDTLGLQLDFAGHSRILQDTVDIGAFESYSTSGILEPFFHEKSFLMNASPNVLQVNQSIVLQLFNLGDEKTFHFCLIDLDGRERYRTRLENVPSQTPVSYSIPPLALGPGFYLLSVTDEKGHKEIQKIIFQ